MGSHGGKIIPFHEARQFGRYALNIVCIIKVILFKKSCSKSHVTREYMYDTCFESHLHNEKSIFYRTWHRK